MTMRTVHRQYIKTIIPAMLAYVVVLFGSVYTLKNAGSTFPLYLRAILSLAPVIPIVFVCRAMIRFLKNCDELERQIELEAIALSCLITGLGFLCLGFLASAKLIYLNGGMVAIWVFPTLCGLYGLTKCFTSWRYR